MGGQVVRARMGDRASYRPLESPLSPTSDPMMSSAACSRSFRFRRFMSPISTRSRAAGTAALRRIRAEFPSLQVWVDNGAADASSLHALVGADLGTPVIGSKSQRDSKLIAQHRDPMRIVLSLDFRGDAFQGPKILAEPALWPQPVIVMTLARVGSGAGADLARLAAIRSIAGGREIYAAGGVRDAADLSALKAQASPAP